MVYGKESMVALKNYGTSTISNGKVTNINVNAQSYDSATYGYVVSRGSVFTVTSLAKNSAISNSIAYMFKNVSFDNVYSNKGGALLVKEALSISEYHTSSLKLNSFTIQNSWSYTNAPLFIEAGKFQITMENSSFTSNTGIQGEADLRVEK